MKKFFNLIKNESVKQFKKRSFVVLLIVLAVICAGFPVLEKFMESRYQNQDEFSFLTRQLKDTEDYLKQQKESLKTATTEKEQILLGIDETEYQIMRINLQIKHNISHQDWRFGVLDQLVTSQRSLEYLKKNDKIPENSKKNFERKLANLPEDNDVPAETKEEQIAKYEKEIAKYTEIIEKNDYKTKINEDFISAEKNYNENKKMYDDFKAKLEKNTNSTLDIEEYGSITNGYYMVKANYEAAKIRLEKNINYEESNPYNTMLRKYVEYSTNAQKELIEEKYYPQFCTSNPNLPEKYEKYKSGFLERKKDNEKKFNELKYGLENEIVDLDSSTSTRKSVASVFQFLLVITLLAAIVTGGIISTEFSKGTIRLLLTRPVSRTKILMSKYATSLFISLIFLVVGTLSVVISSICLYGVGDLSVNMLSFNNGVVTQIPFILWLILKILFSSISIIFVVTASFMLSTLTKNTAVAVGLSVAVSIGSQILTQLLIMSRTFSKIVGYTPIPYINLAEYATDSYLKSMVMQEQRFIFLNENYGAILLLILTAVMLIISIISFKKRDVMN